MVLSAVFWVEVPLGPASKKALTEVFVNSLSGLNTTMNISADHAFIHSVTQKRNVSTPRSMVHLAFSYTIPLAAFFLHTALFEIIHFPLIKFLLKST